MASGLSGWSHNKNSRAFMIHFITRFDPQLHNVFPSGRPIKSSGISSFKFPSQKPHNMGEKYFAHLEEAEHEIIEMREEEEGEGPSRAALDRLLNWTLLSAIVYIILNSTYLFGPAFRTPDASVQDVFWELVQITYGPISHSSPPTPLAKLSSHYILFRGLVYTSILLGFVVAFLIVFGKSFMGYCPLDLIVSPRRNSRRRSSHLPLWFRRTLEILPSAFPLAQAVFSTAILVMHHFAL